MTFQLFFTVEGTPVGKGRPKFARRGNFVTAYTPTKTRTYESLIAEAAKKEAKAAAIVAKNTPLVEEFVEETSEETSAEAAEPAE